MKKLRLFLIENSVVITFIVLLAIAIPASKLPGQFLLQEILTRLGRSSFLVISLLLPIMAGMGLNFGMVLGAMAGQIGLIFISDWGVIGIPGLLLAMIISLPISVILGWLCGSIMNKAKGREMVTGYILAFFMNGVYMLFALYAMGIIIPVLNLELLLSRGFGLRNVIDLINVRQCLETFIPLKIAGVNIPVLNYLIIAAVGIFIVWFRKTKFGQDMRAAGQDRAVASAAGISVDRTRIFAIIISTVLAGFGQIIFLQNMGTINTTNSHEQTGLFAIASLLIGGASVTKASIPNALIGVILFHLLFLVAPMAGKNLVGSAMIGEYFRQFVSYGVIALALVLYEWKRVAQEDASRAMLRGGVAPDKGKVNTL
ncbi:MAG: ABC transporter permease [Synergistaceae bacterium]|nr:ABC transporter permease [Synergistaceae bacterium]